VAFVLAIGIALGLAVIFAGLGWNADQPGPPICLEDTINPNTAPVASLLRLPGVGPQRVQAMVAYREQVRQQRGGPVFRGVHDLEAVPGLGPATVAAMAPYLRFSEK
jgi:hypothetical protein